MAGASRSRRELGDFQTPLELANDVLDLAVPKAHRWTRVLEPTCGVGNFLVAAARHNPGAEMFGIELQEQHADTARSVLSKLPVRATVETADFFTYDLSSIPWQNKGPLLVVGNPPWVTAATLGAMGSSNRPTKTNWREVPGVAALTGESNFDLAECVWMRLLVELASQDPMFILLCKTSVARRLLMFAQQFELPVADARAWRIDTRRHFGVTVDACAFMIRLEGSGHKSASHECPLYPDLRSPSPVSTMSVVNGGIVADADSYTSVAHLDGASSFTWRTGVNHGLAAVMELTRHDGHLRNGHGKIVNIESEHIYPLMKCSDLNVGKPAGSRQVILTQTRVGQETDHLRDSAPLLWSYLNEWKADFHRRKSSVYRNKPAFSVFGIGPYTFAPYKVAVSGFHKAPKFRLLTPVDGRPVVLDDTCYFLAFDDLEEARSVCLALRSGEVESLIRALLFPDAKRPITKKLLMRIDLGKVLDRL